MLFHRKIILIAHNIRSAHNIGSIMRTADAMGVRKIYLSGYSPYPKQINDKRLPYMIAKQTALIRKTALGAETALQNQHIEDLYRLISQLKVKGYSILGIEQTDNAVDLDKFKPTSKTVLIFGNEISGLESDVINMVETTLQVPMLGKKESLNVSVAAAIAMYHFRYS